MSIHAKREQFTGEEEDFVFEDAQEGESIFEDAQSGIDDSDGLKNVDFLRKVTLNPEFRVISNYESEQRMHSCNFQNVP